MIVMGVVAVTVLMIVVMMVVAAVRAQATPSRRAGGGCARSRHVAMQPAQRHIRPTIRAAAQAAP
ncbi:MAG: hypothetical protein BroJett024_08430 [Alphaproteobacteria bacterium]|nr:MAG: hypothetical protein BroJett024_08430 [Alphaproteobacteria bacterium]